MLGWSKRPVNLSAKTCSPFWNAYKGTLRCSVQRSFYSPAYEESPAGLSSFYPSTPDLDASACDNHGTEVGQDVLGLARTEVPLSQRCTCRTSSPPGTSSFRNHPLLVRLPFRFLIVTFFSAKWLVTETTNLLRYSIVESISREVNSRNSL